jgi:hypothetical protein
MIFGRHANDTKGRARHAIAGTLMRPFPANIRDQPEKNGM